MEVIKEGVIQYRLHVTSQALPATLAIAELEACRARLFAHGLIGQDPKRYDGLGYGNVSVRAVLEDNPNAFLITGSQTGCLSQLKRQDYALVTACDPQANELFALGEIAPSSEAMTHAVIYQILPQIQAIIHVHSEYLWQNAQQLMLPCTAVNIPYGTPQMAAAVQSIVLAQGVPQGILAMLGHTDGIVTWGATLVEAEQQLIQSLIF
ncbi:class II aldolase/adducin family protein [Candidatus Thiothrix anitrata]|jgi:ribulose-5-phosphate 4-epimerase/fuculose-1-phosphate aldolase|uniref:Class II aldolase/adducin family protein n=1 Tax=Candidatus Thiothrix anitrata TaxID=2823902 RepID=A0ABX7X1U4_9GAMM|nr:class II aldolase/adducin family protein [Candidatus Thiothrix anitrata]QTR49897.1 class II aldolase/adducin family protein [Candidatus Thiothrix anitrata]